MISYELAKQLKEEGFSQKGKYEGKLVYLKDIKQAGLRIGDVYIPSLSELIEACGDDFRSLEKHYGQIGATNHITPWYGAKDVYMDETMVGITGITPEEAVANLWLELNKK